jgi:N-acetylglucosaminyl-diphospho-decaprenol L-rhamnosyltransferase
MDKTPISFIVVEYKSRPEIDALIQSIEEFEPSALVIVSSNSLYSKEEQADFKNAFPHINVLFNKRNGGYAYGVNRALEQVTTPYAVLLNPDVELLTPFSKEVEAVFLKYPKLAVFSPLVLDGDGQDTTVARRFWVPYFGFARLMERFIPLSLFQKAHQHYLRMDCPQGCFAPVDFVSGGAMVINMAAYRAVSGMDERYFMYMEDVDWCHQFWDAGWWVAMNPMVKVIHHAKHESTRNLWKALSSRTTRAHLQSYWRYYQKWGGKQYSPSDHFELENAEDKN